MVSKLNKVFKEASKNHRYWDIFTWGTQDRIKGLLEKNIMKYQNFSNIAGLRKPPMKLIKSVASVAGKPAAKLKAASMNVAGAGAARSTSSR